MSKQPYVELPIVTAENSLGKSTAVKRTRGRPNKQTGASFGRSEELPDRCADHGLEKSSESTTVKRKRGRPNKQTEARSDRSEELPDMCAEHGIGKSSESTTVKRKQGRPNKQTEASFGRSEALPDMCAEHGLGKSSDVERKRTRLAELITLQQLLTKCVGWFTVKPSVKIVALGRRSCSYHRCVECEKKGLQDAEGKYGCVEHPEAETKETYPL